MIIQNITFTYQSDWLRYYLTYPLSTSSVCSWSKPCLSWPNGNLNSWVTNLYFEPKTSNTGNLVTYGVDSTVVSIVCKHTFSLFLICQK